MTANILLDVVTNQLLSEILTKRGYEITKYFMLGLSDEEIAEVLFLTAATVRTHRSRVYKDLGIQNFPGESFSRKDELRQRLFFITLEPTTVGMKSQSQEGTPQIENPAINRTL